MKLRKIGKNKTQHFNLLRNPLLHLQNKFTIVGTFPIQLVDVLTGVEASG
jgi:hypothetical protein